MLWYCLLCVIYLDDIKYQNPNIGINSVFTLTLKFFLLISANNPFLGDLYDRSLELAKLLEKQKKEGVTLLPFNEILYCNVGNPHLCGQKPLTFFRQVVALTEYPELLNSPNAESMFPRDVVSRSCRLLSAIVHTGAYSSTTGVKGILQNIANFIEKRDGHPSDPSTIFITDGATQSVRSILHFLISGRDDGIMTPVPQYPLYTISIKLNGGTEVFYYLNEESNWSLEITELERAYQDSVAKGVTPRALVIINPGNPTGQILDESNMKEIVLFCHKKSMILIADEVYQGSIFTDERPFISFKKVVCDLGEQVSGIELVSVHSISKGPIGECGKRGGYMELHGFSKSVIDEMVKLASFSMCPNVIGQVLIDLMVCPPVEGDESYPTYKVERDATMNSLRDHAKLLVDTLNSLEGVTCNQPMGSLYAMPRLRLPPAAIAEAKSLGREPDEHYCLQLLEEKGILVTSGNAFGQREGTYHFRSTFLPPMEKVCKGLKEFHENFMLKYK
ncbi:hypothetical protein PPL_05305 [Heterostelium album PN500]|uniref:Aminotransferase class I/classII large domain-containing protein n=1 Tax=Heterostelium pallidum (strain ATCC 26659 / Pp 5 / PN500) TaxID=670386 RepID=D3BBB8_HETP5|nr:hypothetical protein PPL_05305 [Heterostelium album PN500]EFA81325.1 hypothetical protein PPL_05305 [Heterostelium album PN500]|eukprot:XP_020433443.1 hypothetical protein PPL_05305 [Heterostelium album PN500]